MRNDLRQTSRYRRTPITEFYMDIWVAPTVTESPNDSLFEIDPRYNKRPDLLAYDLYGTVDYWWVFAMRNKDTLVDPINDFLTGTIIYIPSI